MTALPGAVFALWLPARWPSTNDALNMQRAAGFGQGFARAKLESGEWKRRKAFADEYAESARAFRLLACQVAKLAKVPPLALADVVVSHVGHEMWDPDAGLLSAKWIVDGLADAGVFVSDRFNLHRLTVCRARDEIEAHLVASRCGRARWDGKPGAFVEIRPLVERGGA